VSFSLGHSWIVGEVIPKIKLVKNDGGPVSKHKAANQDWQIFNHKSSIEKQEGCCKLNRIKL
jgi:hypothetical protein